MSERDPAMSRALRDFCAQAPFIPIHIHLTDGRVMDVIHPDFLFLTHSGNLLTIFDPRNSIHTINVGRIVSVSRVAENAESSQPA